MQLDRLCDVRRRAEEGNVVEHALFETDFGFPSEVSPKDPVEAMGE